MEAADPPAGVPGGSSGKEKETVKVVVRCRPLFGKEIVEGRKSIVTLDAAAALISLKCPENGQLKAFTFDSVYDESTSQRQFYDESGYPLVESIFDGYNGTIFAYGQTGCGKTHTMQGKDSPPELRGVIPLSFDHIFDTINSDSTREYMVRASYLEIYNEDIRDLLSDDSKKRLELKESADGTVYVKDLTEVVVRDVESMNNVMNRGFKNRTVGATLMVKKERFGLSALGNVISALVDGKGKHIPYRDSKLTRLLQDSLGGNTKTLMVAAVSPADYNYDETLSTLRYANRAKNIKNKPVVNEDPKDAKLREYKEEIERLRKLLESQSQSRGSGLSSSSGMTTPSRPLSPRSGSGQGVRYPEDNINLAKEREEIARYQQEAAEMLERAKSMMDEAKALQVQREQAGGGNGSNGDEVRSSRLQNGFEDATGASDAEEVPFKPQRKGSGALGSLPPLQGLSGKHDQLVTPGLSNSSVQPEDLTAASTPKQEDVAIKQAMREAARIDAQARAMMAKAEAMMKETAQRSAEAKKVEVVVKEVIPDSHVKEQEELREMNQTILNQRDRIGQELEQTQVAMETYLREKEMLHAKLKKIESHILGGASMSSATQGIDGNSDGDSEVALLKQQVEYRRAQIKLREKAKKQAKNETVRRALELEKQHVQEELKTAQEAAQASLAAARKKEAKYRAKLDATRQEIADLNSEFERERENLLDTIREQTKEAKLLEQLVELFLPQNELVKVWERAVWSDEREEWNLPKLKPRSDFQKIKLPSLPLTGGGGSGAIESGGAEVMSDEEEDGRQGNAGVAGHSTVRSSGSASSAKRRKSGASRAAQTAQNGAIVPHSKSSDQGSEDVSLTRGSGASARLPSAVHSSRAAGSAVSRGMSPHNSSSGGKERRKPKEKSVEALASAASHYPRQPHEDPEQHPIAGVYETPSYFPADSDLLAPLSSDYQPRDRLQSRQGSRQDSRQERNERGGGNPRGTPSGLGQLDHSPPAVAVTSEKLRSSSRGESGSRHSSHRHHRHRERKERQQDDEGDSAGLGGDVEWLEPITAPPGSGDGTATHGSRKKSSGKHSKKKKERRDRAELTATENDEDPVLPADSVRHPSLRSLEELL
ncbi:hypothetical protein BBJ28_00006394 [Nothophytophthora sp. Chile5]|nr:hypothetical protein BBJ28_00006394 [Nothophytophthora sp. Chile5]